MAVDLSKSFDEFITGISLTQTAISRIARAYSTLAEFLVPRLDLVERDVFLQGSYPNGTAIRPLEGGEYDADVVCVMGADGEGADSALNRLQALFEADKRYASRVVPKKPCIRLEYAEDGIGKFHVDVVPVRIRQTGGAPFEAPRRGEGWHTTAPGEYTQWCLDQGVLFERTVKALKRWRDDQQTVRHAIKSVVLQVLVAEHMPQEVDDAIRLHGTIARLHTALSALTTCPVVANPVLPSENLARRWTVESMKEFVAELAEAREIASRAVATEDPIEAADCWREILGESFPSTPSTDLGMRVSDDSHAQTFVSKGWSESLDERYGVRVVATTQRGRRSPRWSRYENNGPLVFHGHMIRFEALTWGDDDVEVWWQVANTGRHAREVDALRGNFFRGRLPDGKPSSNPREDWENTKYTGSHWIRAVLVKNGRVVAVSDKFMVNVYNKGRAFGL